MRAAHGVTLRPHFLELTILLGLVTSHLAAQRIDVRDGSFGYVNADGSEVMALDSIAHPSLIRAALCPRARVYRVAYARRQTRRPADTGRQVAANFGNERGDVFRVSGGQAQANETCYLTADSSLVAGVVLAGPGTEGGCDTTRLRHASEIKHRAVVNCWPLGNASPSVALLALQFTVVDTSALASIVMADRDQFFFFDLPATYHGPEADVWRVEDGGTFSPEAFGVPFFGRLHGTYFMALTWAGAEGEDSYLLVTDSAHALRTVTKSYRYWVPN